MKRVLAIYGSPRSDKNTDTALNCFLNRLGSGYEIQRFYIRERSIAPCTACDYCTTTRGCVINDDMQLLYTALNEADIIVVGSPLYFNSVSAGLKCAIDRCQAIWSNKFCLKASLIAENKKRTGLFIGTAGSKNADFTGALLVIELFFKAVGAGFTDKLLIDNTDKKPVIEDAALIDRVLKLNI